MVRYIVEVSGADVDQIETYAKGQLFDVRNGPGGTIRVHFDIDKLAAERFKRMVDQSPLKVTATLITEEVEVTPPPGELQQVIDQLTVRNVKGLIVCRGTR